ncbi:restriction endonuclease subunit S [Arthrobacter yangruifuii]|uniref:restriction endonuclease subunit S n=1 Tax=Arthrobacter yangruifuii TaxID=2606616 RepID=UPI0011B40590|nr:restriction endonuclease subunit S [Arthrobacter yangruifuii]
MIHIDELLTNLCPNGVIHRALKEVASYSDTRISADKVDATSFVGVDNLLSNKAGRTDATYLPNTARLAEYKAGDILIGNIRPYLKKVWLADRTGGCSGDVLAIRLVGEWRRLIAPRFLYYLLSSDSFFAYSMQHAKGAKMPRGNKQAILDFRIPVPPLEVQREIVRILDQFTQVEAELKVELEAELEARRRQYEHYRNKLSIHDAPSVALGDIARYSRDRVNADTLDEKSFVGVDNLLANNRGKKDAERLPNTARLTAYEPNDVLIGNIRPYLKKVWLADSFGGCSGDVLAIRLLPENEGLIVPNFLYYCLSSEDFVTFNMRHARGGKMPRGDKEAILDYRVPIPPLEVQREVVGVLNQLGCLEAAFVSTLKAEVEARRKEYEYYCNRLLTFDEPFA